MTDNERQERLARLTEEVEHLRRSLPARSVKPARLIRIEELEEEIESLQPEEKAPTDRG